jgi:hypothetical protein
MSSSRKKIFVLDMGRNGLDLFADVPEHSCKYAWDPACPEKGWSAVCRALRLVSSERWDLAVVNMREFCFLRRHAPLVDGVWRGLQAACRSPRQFGELLVFARLKRLGTPLALLNRTDRGGVWDGSDWFFRNSHACFIRELNPDPRWPLLHLPETNRWARRLAGLGRTGVTAADWDKLWPISLGLPDPALYPPPGEKQIDVLYGHGADSRNKPLRDRLLAELQRECRRLGLNLKLVDRVPKPEWIRLMGATRLVFSPPGVGWDCWRHYEAMMAGAIPLMTYPTILRYQAPLEGVHGFYFAPEPGGLGRALESAITRKDGFLEMYAACRRLVQEHHTWPKLREHVIGRTLESASRKQS